LITNLWKIVSKGSLSLFSLSPFYYELLLPYPARFINGGIRMEISFLDTPPPPGVEVEIKEFKEKASDGPKGKENINLPRPKSESFKEKRSYSDVHVIMYMTSWCPYCDKARTYLRSLDVNLVEYNIEQDKKKREEMLVKSGGSSGVPLIDVEGIIIRGYNPDALKAAIERRRSL
jgi:glutaredoxin